MIRSVFDPKPDEPSPRPNPQLVDVLTQVLPPNKSLFKERKKTHCFGAGREHFTKIYNPCNPQPDAIVPGPGTYADSTRNVGVQARKWSLQARNIYMDNTSLALKRAVPDPCKYGDP
jgi:hypothetical protein